MATLITLPRVDSIEMEKNENSLTFTNKEPEVCSNQNSRVSLIKKMTTLITLPRVDSIEMEKNENNLTFTNKEPEVCNENGTKIISFQEVSWHDQPHDCWIVIYDRVYDVSRFLDQHPGGEEILLEHAGRDASVAFRGTGHSAFAIKQLNRFLIGELPMEERIFRKPGGFKISDLPK